MSKSLHAKSRAQRACLADEQRVRCRWAGDPQQGSTRGGVLLLGYSQYAIVS
jgi:hypothetical protein